MRLQYWPFEDILRGVQSAQLTRELPIDIKILISNLSIGFAVRCVGVREAALDNGIQTRRDINCIVKKFSEKSQKEDWICWPCLDFLKKSKPKHRTGLKCMYNFSKRPQQFGIAHCSIKKNNIKVGKKKPEMSKDVKNADAIKVRLGEFKIKVDAMDHRSAFFGKNFELKSNTIPWYPYVRKCSRDISSLRYC